MSIQNDVEKLYRSDLEKQRQKQKNEKEEKLLGIMLIVNYHCGAYSYNAVSWTWTRRWKRSKAQGTART